MKAIPVEIRWHSGMPVYASEPFLRAVGDEYGWIGGIDNSGCLLCVLPYTVIRKAGFRMARFRVETIPIRGELEIGLEKTFLNSVVEHFRSAGTDMIIPGGNTSLFRTYPDGAKVAPYGTLLKDLSRSEEALLHEISPDYRKNIRRATNGGVQIKCGIDYLDAAYALIGDTLKRSDVSVKKRDDFMKQVLSLGEHVSIFVAEYQGTVQACMVCPFSMHSAYSWYSGTVAQPFKGAMHLLQWEAIRNFRGIGVKRFNFTGVRIDPEKNSKQEGIKNFKMRFGGELVQGYMWEYALKRIKFAAYSVGMHLFRRGDNLRFSQSTGC
jgi:hypothetical protein